MKTNLLPEMQQMTLLDSAGTEVELSIEVRRGENGLYVFLADANQLGSSRLAQDAVHFLDSVSQTFDLAQEQVTFFRHIYQDQMGSLFGRYSVDWNAQTYRFQMLTNIDEVHNVKDLINSTIKLDINELDTTPKVVNA